MIRKILTVFLVLLALLLVFKDKMIEFSIERSCEMVTGVELDIKEMEWDIVKSVIWIKDVKMYNPEGFSYKLLADIPEIYVNYDLSVISRGVMYLREVRVYIKEFDVVKNRQGIVNLSFLKPFKNKTNGVELEGDKNNNIPDIKIDSLRLKADKAFYRDYSREGDPKVHVFNVNLDEKFENITDLYTLIRLVVSQVLERTAVSNIVNIPMEGVNVIVKSAYEKSTIVIKGAVGTATDATGQFLGGTQGVLKSIIPDLFTENGTKNEQ
ncbi:MAG: hypothetical protein KAI70_05760 [Candidatus Omnitrophica bacterium]|nr:hypothetical protein [Candidatus Omnitrophota bacterium]